MQILRLLRQPEPTRTAAKVSSSQYWRPKFRGHQISSKLKFYQSTHTSWFQNWQKCQNRSKIDNILLHMNLVIFGILKIILGVVIKVHQFCLDLDIFGHFDLMTSKFWPSVVRGQNFGGRAGGCRWPQGPQNLHEGSLCLPTAMV